MHVRPVNTGTTSRERSDNRTEKFRQVTAAVPPPPGQTIFTSAFTGYSLQFIIYYLQLCVIVDEGWIARDSGGIAQSRPEVPSTHVCLKGLRTTRKIPFKTEYLIFHFCHCDGSHIGQRHVEEVILKKLIVVDSIYYVSCYVKHNTDESSSDYQNRLFHPAYFHTPFRRPYSLFYLFRVILDKQKINSFPIITTEKNCRFAERYLWPPITWPFNQAVSHKHFTYEACIYS